MSEDSIISLLCAIIRGANPDWPYHGGLSSEDFIRLCDYHGVSGLVRSRIPASWPDEIKSTLSIREIARSFWEAGHRDAISTAVAALREAGAEPLLLKGTALAYSLYESPALRARGDTDILIAYSQAKAAAKALSQAGFERLPNMDAQVTSYQKSYVMTDRAGERHVIDLHRKINNSPVLARCFSHGELRMRAAALPALCEGAMGLSAIDALLLGAMHRATHIHNPYYHDGAAHLGGDRLIWLYDLHLIADTLPRADWQTMWRLADEKGLADIMRRALKDCELAFGTSIIWRNEPDKNPAGAASIYLSSKRLRQLWMDFLANDGLAEKARFAIELGFPPREYLLAKYGKSANAWLPLLYARRAAEGAFKRLG